MTTPPLHDAAPADCAVDAPPYRVLLVEDNPTNQRLMRRLLEAMHCQVDLAGNGRDAVTKVAGARYEVIFMDCHMPIMDGYDAAAEIRRTEPAERLPIVAVTASIMPEDHRRCLQVGMNEVLTKPVEPDQIRRALVRWCARPNANAAPHPNSNSNSGFGDSSTPQAA